MQQYGANAWRVYNYRLEVVGKSLDKAIEEMNDRVTEVNRTRKNDQVSAATVPRRTHTKIDPRLCLQMAVGKQLTGLEQKWTELISSVLQIEIANSALEAEIAMLGQREAELEQMVSQ
jgi:pre-mRNA-splicing factor SPF27